MFMWYLDPGDFCVHLSSVASFRFLSLLGKTLTLWSGVLFARFGTRSNSDYRSSFLLFLQKELILHLCGRHFLPYPLTNFAIISPTVIYGPMQHNIALIEPSIFNLLRIVFIIVHLKNWGKSSWRASNSSMSFTLNIHILCLSWGYVTHVFSSVCLISYCLSSNQQLGPTAGISWSHHLLHWWYPRC